MYLAPLNYDRYFKKVFSDIKIAKRFLEDFFDVEIEEIELLDKQHNITDDAAGVEFDFRCKIAGQIVIIDMQQWYKQDVTRRFYLYHTLNTALQLENFPLKSIALSSGKVRKIKDYRYLVPVITLIWMVDDTFNMQDDFVAYTMTPEIVLEFMRNNYLWKKQDLREILKQRDEALKILNNKTKNLDFLQENRLIYAFQPNIVKNKKYSRYFDWFVLAEKTLNEQNTKEDFDEFRKDEVFLELMRKITKEYLPSEDFAYISEYRQLVLEVERYEQGLIADATKEGMRIGKEKGLEEGEQIGLEKGRSQTLYEMAKKSLLAGLTISQVVIITELSEQEVTQIAKNLGLNF